MKDIETVVGDVWGAKKMGNAECRRAHEQVADVEKMNAELLRDREKMSTQIAGLQSSLGSNARECDRLRKVISGVKK